MIKIITTRIDFDNYRHSLTQESVGLVPTMGNLHAGHISLLKESLLENDVVILTIFVNPKQFGEHEDFHLYPRTLKKDCELVSQIETSKQIILWAPENSEEIFPANFSTSLTVKGITEKFEGALRPTHFEGVATVVYLLFKITKAHKAYFGQKDFQQALVIKKMVSDLEIPIVIKIMPIIRNSSGLALSSRNQYLTDEDKIKALTLPQTLKKIEELILNKKPYLTFAQTALQEDKNWDYLEILNAKTLLPALPLDVEELVVLGAYRVGKTRLLDNILINTKKVFKK